MPTKTKKLWPGNASMSNPPHSVAHWIIEALRYLVEQEKSDESASLPSVLTV